MKYKLAILVAFLSLVTGCSYNVTSYETSAQNVETLKSYNLQPVSVGTFQASEKPAASRKCADHYLSVSPSFEDYIEKAFIDELKLAGIYDASSSLVLTGMLEQIESSPSSNLGPGWALKPRRWTFTLTLTNARNESFTTQSEFSIPRQREDVCGRLALVFAPAVQQLITDVIKNPKFREIAN